MFWFTQVLEKDVACPVRIPIALEATLLALVNLCSTQVLLDVSAPATGLGGVLLRHHLSPPSVLLFVPLATTRGREGREGIIEQTFPPPPPSSMEWTLSPPPSIK